MIEALVALTLEVISQVQKSRVSYTHNLKTKEGRLCFQMYVFDKQERAALRELLLLVVSGGDDCWKIEVRIAPHAQR